MEFRLAAEGNTDELRQWLRGHPERINVPAQGSNMTLLYTAISNANRTDLASLQAGHSRYLSTVRMLCEEYKADVSAPNGGSYNTALHMAASIGATDILRYLVEGLHAPVNTANVFGERPLQMAERSGHTECASILRRAAMAQEQAAAQTVQTAGRVSPTPPAGGAAAGGNPTARFHSVTVSDSDDEGNNNNNTIANNTGNPNAYPFSQPPQGNTNVNTPAFFSSGAPSESGRSGPGTNAVAQRQYSGTSSHHSPALPPKPQYGTTGFTPGALPPTQTPGRRNSTPGSTPLLSSRDGWASSAHTPSGAYSPRRVDSSASVGHNAEPPLPQPVRPRKEYDITKSRILANPDLQGFRSAYGDGFKYIQCSDHYEIRGMLPYTYRGTVYYTPVVISVYAPASALDSGSSTDATATTTTAATATNTSVEGRDALGNASDPNSPLGTLGSQKSGIVSDSGSNSANNRNGTTATTSPPKEVYCRYRVCLSMQSLNDFAISRKAEYLDPVSGAVIPAPGDDKYQTLTAYIRNVVVRNFEAVPPLIVPTSVYAFPLRPNISLLGTGDNSDVFRHHHSHNAPAFMKNALPNRTAAHLRCAAILRDLSKFGDGLGRYFPTNHRIVVYVPIFSEHKAAVLAMPQERPYTTTVDQNSTPASPGGGANDPRPMGDAVASSAGKKGVTQQIAVQAVAELQVRVWMQFIPIAGTGARAVEAAVVDGRDGGVYTYPPRVYLIDAAARPPVTLTGSATPAANSLTGACFASLLRDRETGEVDPELLKLSQESWSAKGSVYEILVELQRVLRDTVESFAVRYTGRNPASTPVQQANAAANSYGGFGGGNGGSSGSVGAAGGSGMFTSGSLANAMNASPAPSPLDNFFTSPTTPAQPSISGVNNGSGAVVAAAATGNGGGQAGIGNGVGRCLYCFQVLQTRTLLQPCGHDGVCGLCVQRLQSHCREEVFACPVCRQAVRNVMEVFL